ncbi:MAG: cytochrome P450, partial [Chloroflexota bacterium]|nr:cytochrome P450 [Chloroflexota bacterium]
MVDALPKSIKDLRDEEPWDFYEARRAQGQVVWDDPANAWLVLGYDEAAYVERNEDIFAETTAALPGADRLTHPREFRLLNGEPHRILHKFLSKLWAPSAFEQYRTPVVRQIIDERIARLRHCGEAELWSDFASIVPIAVVAELIGLPSDDDEQLRACKDWTEAVLLWRHTYGEDQAVVDAAADASGHLDPFIGPLISARRTRPTGDLISRLWEIGPTIFPDWDEDDILANVKPLFEAGSDTSSNLICSVLYAVLTDQSIRTAVRDGGE